VKNYSLPKNTVIKKSSEFRSTIRNGFCHSTQFFTAYSIKAPSVRIGFAAKKGYKNKPQRNRIKRITRELWRQCYGDYYLPAEIVIMASPSLLKQKYKDLEADFCTLLEKIEKHYARYKMGEKSKFIHWF